MIDAATVFAGLATSLTVASGWPQIRRLRDTGDRHGVSVSTAALSVASEIGWLIYLSGERLWSALPEAGVTIVVSLALATAMVRAGAAWTVAVSTATAWCALLVAARLAGGQDAIALMLSVTYALQLFPAVWTAWRVWCPSGVSPGSWTVRCAQSVLWGCYGLVRGDPPLVTLGVIGSVASAAVLVRLVMTRARLRAGRLAPALTA